MASDESELTDELLPMLSPSVGTDDDDDDDDDCNSRFSSDSSAGVKWARLAFLRANFALVLERY